MVSSTLFSGVLTSSSLLALGAFTQLPVTILSTSTETPITTPSEHIGDIGAGNRAILSDYDLDANEELLPIDVDLVNVQYSTAILVNADNPGQEVVERLLSQFSQIFAVVPSCEDYFETVYLSPSL